jgi:hypothetical protein
MDTLLEEAKQALKTFSKESMDNTIIDEKRVANIFLKEETRQRVSISYFLLKMEFKLKFLQLAFRDFYVDRYSTVVLTEAESLLLIKNIETSSRDKREHTWEEIQKQSELNKKYLYSLLSFIYYFYTDITL